VGRGLILQNLSPRRHEDTKNGEEMKRETGAECNIESDGTRLETEMADVRVSSCLRVFVVGGCLFMPGDNSSTTATRQE
jgi:hypothetical protein